MRGAIQPTGEHDSLSQGAGFARQIGEHHLCYVLGEMCIPRQLPHRRRVDEVDMARNEFAERSFIGIVCELTQKFGIVAHVSTNQHPAGLESDMNYTGEGRGANPRVLNLPKENDLKRVGSRS